MNAFLKNIQIYPLLGSSYSLNDFFHIDLSEKNETLSELESQEELSTYLEKQRQNVEKHFAFGGYGEKRNLYQSDLFKKDNQIRNIHLAIDVWAYAGVKLYAPIDGVIASVAYNNNGLDYGNTLIIKHNVEENQFFTLYGHLASSIFELWKAGDHVKRGAVIGQIGNISENGGWSPHVHCQIILDLEGNTEDYPGVCSEVAMSKYLENCPDPSILVLPNE